MKTPNFHELSQTALLRVASGNKLADRMRLGALSHVDDEDLANEKLHAVDPLLRFGVFQRRAQEFTKLVDSRGYRILLEQLTPESVDYPDYLTAQKLYNLWSTMIALRMGWFDVDKVQSFIDYYRDRIRPEVLLGYNPTPEKSVARLKKLTKSFRADIQTLKEVTAVEKFEEVLVFLSTRDLRVRDRNRAWVERVRPEWVSAW